MKSIKHLYNEQIYKVFRLAKKLKSEKNKLTRIAIMNQLSEAQAYARELDGIRNESYQIATLMLTSCKETDLINAVGHKFINFKKQTT